MGGEYVSVAMPDGSIFKSFVWTRPERKGEASQSGEMRDWHTEPVTGLGINPETGRKEVYTVKLDGSQGVYDYAKAAEYHPLKAGDVVVVEREGAATKIFRCTEGASGSPIRGRIETGAGRFYSHTSDTSLGSKPRWY